MRSSDEVGIIIIGGTPPIDRDAPIRGEINVALGGPDTLGAHVDVDLHIGGSVICWVITDTPGETEPTTLLPELPHLDLTVSIGMMSDFIVM
jgi:hypothetical protein